MLRNQALEEVIVLVPLFPGQHQVPGEDAVPHGVEAAAFIAVGRGCPCIDVAVAHDQKSLDLGRPTARVVTLPGCLSRLLGRALM